MLTIGDRLSKVVGYILTSYQPDFAVLQGNTLLGIITRADVLRALASDPRDVYVTGIMQRDVIKVDVDASLAEMRQVISEHGARVAAVYDNSAYLGLISLEDITEAFAVLSLIQRQQDLKRIEQAQAES